VRYLRRLFAASSGNRARCVSCLLALSSSLLAAGELRAAPRGRSAPARLVVALVYDQLGSDTLLRQLSFLDPAGALRQAIDAGVFLERSSYPYASTLTAPGHAAIHTGTPPSINGIDNNSVWDERQEKPVAVVFDPAQRVFGQEGASAGVGPARLRAPTVAAQLKAETKGAGRVVSLSLKDRAAVLSVGSAADLVLWFDSTLGAFTSSSVWGPQLPSWLGRYQAEHPVSALLTPWLPLDEARYAQRLGPDAAPGEGDLNGFGTTFPHVFEHMSKPLSAFACAPQSSEYLIELAQAAVREQGLGQDEVPDLLALSISGTDCAGHVFGPGSWEYVDHLVRADRAAGRWLERLGRELPLAVLITSDHGVAALPESSLPAGGRIFPSQLLEHLRTALEAQFGAGPWLAGVLSPYVYLTARARAHPEAERLREAVIAALRQEPGVRDVWRISEVRAGQGDRDPLRRALALGVAPDNTADFLFLAAPHHPLDLGEPAGKGTNHGSPYAYDREVPVLGWGRGVPHRRSSEPVNQLRVAATLAHLLGIHKPAQAQGSALF
jgi:predicted AlkP superfamily pyrophosphatase or phosphodiesterase